MKNLTIYSLFLVLIIVSCKREEPLDEIKDLSVPEVEQFFDQHYSSSTQARKSGKRKIKWKKGEYRDISLGDALVFPLGYEDEVFMTDSSESAILPMKANSYALAYKQKGNIHLEVVRTVPTRPSELFTGHIIVEDWKGNKLRYFEYENGNFLGEHEIVDAADEKGRTSNMETVYTCTTIIWYTCWGEIPDDCRETGRETLCVLKEVRQIAGPGTNGEDYGGGGLANSDSGSCPNGYFQDQNGNCFVFLRSDDCNTSKEDILNAFPNTTDADAEMVSKHINKHAADFGIDTKYEMQHFLAQAAHESKRHDGVPFAAFSENLNYRINKLGVDYWVNRFNPASDSLADENKENPYDYQRTDKPEYVIKEKFANFVYGNRDDLGNNQTGDGYKYRGRGLMQLTGRYNYTQFAKYYKDNYDKTKDCLANPGLLSSDKEIGVIAALWFFKTNILDSETIDKNTTVDDLSLIVNGGDNGLEDRRVNLKKTKEHIICN